MKKANSVYQRRKFNAIKRNMKNGMDAKKAEETEMKKLSERNKRWREKNKDKVKFYAERIKAKKR